MSHGTADKALPEEKGAKRERKSPIGQETHRETKRQRDKEMKRDRQRDREIDNETER